MTTTSWIDYEIQEIQPLAGPPDNDHPSHREVVNREVKREHTWAAER